MRIFDIETAKNDIDCVVFELVDAVYVRVKADSGLFHWLSNKFTLRHPQWRVMQKKYPGWKGDIKFLRKDGLLPIGLLRKACKYLDENGYNWYFDPPKGILFNGSITEDNVFEFSKNILFDSGIELRDYQLDALVSILKRKRGIIESGVGSGKSLLIYLISRYMLMNGLKTLIVVPNISLVNQLFNNFKYDYNWDGCDDNCSVIYSGVESDLSRGVIISTWQSLYKKDFNFFKDFGCLIIDEAHGARADSLISVAKNCCNAMYRVGTTGTLPDNLFDLTRIEAYLGEVVFKLTAGDLVKRGVLSKFKINSVFVVNNQEALKSYQEEMNYIESLTSRNVVILDIIKNNIYPDENVVLLFKKREHLKNMYETCINEFPDRVVCEIHGDVEPMERERIRQQINHKGGHILCATYQTMSEGINIPRLNHIIMCSPYRAKIKVMQTLGRVLRKHENKEIAYLWDLVDIFHKKNKSFSWKHYLIRKQYYSENEFELKEISFKIS